MSLAQIGEFAFVLLSRASNLHLIEVEGHFAFFSSFFSLSDMWLRVEETLYTINGVEPQYHVSFAASECETRGLGQLLAASSSLSETLRTYRILLALTPNHRAL